MQKKPSLCFVGSMVGRNAGYITTQGEIMADLFAAEDYEVACVSSKLNRAARLAEIVAVLISGRRRFDLVVLDVFSGLSFIIADVVGLLCKLLKIPLIMVLHGGSLPEFVQKHPRWTKRVFKCAASLVAPSAFLAEKIGVHGFKIKVVPNIIKLDSYPFRLRSSLSPRLIWMRSFHRIYNPQMALNVLAELRKDYPAATLTMAGADKGLEPELKKMAQEMNLGEAVSFPGFLNREQKVREFSAADIYLNTNRIDNMPVSVLEACACGLPVVATNVGGLPFLISDGENGLLVENENVNAMVQAVKMLLTDSAAAQKISRNAGLLAEKSSWTTLRGDWEELFAVVLKQATKKLPPRFSAKNLSSEK
jgi:glycosyltransferase involved in cell wall biosynthesis